MIFKVIGFVIVIASSTLIGIFLGAKGSFRIMDLREFRKAFIVLKSEIEYLNSPLREALLNVSAKAREPISKIFYDASKNLSNSNEQEIFYIWKEAVENNISKTYLAEEDFDYVISFGKCLGHLDKEMQINNINITVEQIQERVGILNQDVFKNKKMFNSLGILFGILICIIFV